MGVPSGKLLIAGLRSKKFAREVPGFKCRPIGSLCSVLPVGFPFDSTKNNLDYQKGPTVVFAARPEWLVTRHGGVVFRIQSACGVAWDTGRRIFKRGNSRRVAFADSRG